MGGRVAKHEECVLVVRVPRRQELDVLAVGQREPHVARLTVDPREHGLLGKLRADRTRRLEAGRALGKLELGRVGEDNLHGA